MSAADALSLQMDPSDILTTDWTAPIAQIKPTVVTLRKTLGVAGTVKASAEVN